MQTIKPKLIQSNDTCQKKKTRFSILLFKFVLVVFKQKHHKFALHFIRILNCSQVSDSQVKSILLSSGKYEETIFILK